ASYLTCNICVIPVIRAPYGSQITRSAALLAALRAVLRAALLAALDPHGVERPADHVIAHARQVAHAPAADEHDRVLLEVVALARDVGRDLLAVGEPHARHLAQRRVRLLRRLGLDLQAHAALLRAGLEHGRLGAPALVGASLAHELIDGGHRSRNEGLFIYAGTP